MFVCPECKVGHRHFSGCEAFLAHFMFEHKDSVKLKKMICGHTDCIGRKFDKANSFRTHVRSHKEVTGVVSPLHSETINDLTIDIDRNEPFVMDVGTDNDANQPLPLNSTGNVIDSAAFDEALTRSVVGFISGLYDSGSFTEAQIQQIVDGHMLMLGGGFLTILKDYVLSLMSSCLVPDKDQKCISRMFDSCQNIYEGFETHYKRVTEVENCGAYIKPEPFSLGPAMEDVVENGTVVKVPVELTGQFVEFRHVLKGFLELPNVLKDILDYVNKLESNINESVRFENVIQGKLWREKIKPKFDGKTVLPLTFAYDDYESNKELGTHTGVHNLGEGTITISCLPPKFKSLLENIFSVLIIYAGNRAKGNHETFRKVVNELLFLEKHGITVVTSEGTFQIYFALVLVVGDNKGANGILGFVESFSANHYCRICFEINDVMKKQVEANPAKRRTIESYDNDLVINNCSLTGRKGPCVFNTLDSFHVSNNVCVDTMHDLDEGVWKYVMYDIVLYFLTKKRFSISYLNELIQGFNYGPNEVKNKPPTISYDDMMKSKRISFNASEFRCFVRYFGLMVGHLVQRGDMSVWNLYLLERRIIDIATAPIVFQGDVSMLRQLIKEHHTLYMRLFKTHLKPKFHIITHQPEIIELLGPLEPLSCYRTESKYKEGKDIAQKSHNRVNLPVTIMKRHQLRLAFRLLSGRGFVPKFHYSGVHCVSVQSIQHYHLFSDLIPADHHGIWNCVDRLHVNGAQYYPGCVVLLAVSPDGETPTFGSIHVISVPKNNCSFLVLRELQTVQFNKHVYAFQVMVSEKWHYVNLDNLVSFLPTELRHVTDKYYVTYRFGIAAFAQNR